MIVATQKINCVCTAWTGNTVKEVTRGVLAYLFLF